MTTTEAPERRRTVRRIVLIAALLVVAVLASATAIAVRTGADAPAEDRATAVLPTGAVAASGVDARSAIVGSASRRTTVRVRAVRLPGPATIPPLHVDFDGSGGGEAVEVDCASPASEWVVGVGSPQTVELTCDRFVDPWRLQGLRFVRLDLRR